MISETLIAKTGTGVTGASILTTFIATALPVVQFIAACIGVCVGVATLVYYIKQIRKK